jgi:hypothetical protein
VHSVSSDACAIFALKIKKISSYCPFKTTLSFNRQYRYRYRVCSEINQFLKRQRSNILSFFLQYRYFQKRMNCIHNGLMAEQSFKLEKKNFKTIFRLFPYQHKVCKLFWRITVSIHNTGIRVKSYCEHVAVPDF